MLRTNQTKCVENFVNRCIEERKRLDGRRMDEFRKLSLVFGQNYGTVLMAGIGETRCSARITCDIAQPRNSQPNEGQMFINVEYLPLVGASADAGASKQPEVALLASRILERTFIDSRCVDLESLCIVSKEKVWHLRVDVTVLNDDGNICDCASYAVLAALYHFRVPCVTTEGDSIVVHTDQERDPIPLVLHHFPLCVSYVIFEDGDYAIADASSVEEQVAKSSITFGMNSYNEFCGLHLGGNALASAETITRSSRIASKHAKLCVDMIRKLVEQNVANRGDGQETLAKYLQRDTLKTAGANKLLIALNTNQLAPASRVKREKEEQQDEAMESNEEAVEEMDCKDTASTIEKISEQSAMLVQSDKWIPDDDDAD